jgi:hypothetical protein
MASFPSIRIEGGLLGPDVLDQVISAELPGQKPADFGLDAKRNLTDEIAAVFTDSRALWGVYQNRLARLPQDDAATTVTRDAWVIPFLGLLGYEPRFNQKAYDVDGQSFAVSHRAGEAEDAPPVHIVGARQELGRLSPSGKPRLAPHSLVQEYLNLTEHVWGLVTNGATFRVLRDSTFIRRQAYLEFDLAGIIEEQRFQDFAALYRLVHRTRMPKGMADAGECLLERYHQHSVEQGGRVRDHLRDGVEDCITRLANGFLSHPANGDLRRALAEKRLSANSFYRQLLRLIYRFLFLLVSEDRGLLSPNPIYREHYGIARLRRLLDQRAAFNQHDDIWHGLRVLWLAFGKPELSTLLDLAPLNGELFAPQTLDDCALCNRELLGAFWHLAWYRESQSAPPCRVNYAALDVEELGSIYESLLEFHPAVEDLNTGKPRFALVFGSDRKTTGSYYTAPELVNQVIQGALDPVIAERLKEAPNAEAKQRALLSLKVIDPACGSGHFLLSAARRIGKALARVRTGEDEPAPERMREAIRDVIGHCIYGVDKNPLAVDLCRVALWIESHNAGKPLSFLDHRIRPGDALLGIFDLATLTDPIPDAAFKALAGDDKAVAREITARNRDESREQIQQQLGLSASEILTRATAHSRSVDAIPDESPADIQRKKKAYDDARHDPDWVREWQAANLWTAAFFAPLTPEAAEGKKIPTTAAVRDTLARRPVQPQTVGWAEARAFKNQFFHWPLEFPEVFAVGGFDIVLSNPPWERVKLQEQEFFASREPNIALARNKAKRGELIRKLPETNPELHREFMDAAHSAEATSLFLRESGRYSLAGRGDINTYAVFAELISGVLAPQGRGGFVVPLGLATDDTTKALFGDFIQNARLVALTGYENEEFIFPAVDHRVTFSTVVLGGKEFRTPEARIGFFVRRFEQLREAHRFFRLSPRDFALLNPNTGNCPIFRTQADAELSKAIYRRVPVLLREGADDGNPWNLSFGTLFHMANDSHHFRTRDQLVAEAYRLEGNVFIGPHDRYLPLYEAKMLHQFDHRFSTYEGATQAQLNVGVLPRPSLEQKNNPAYAVLPDYWIRDEIVESALPHYPEPLHLALQIRDQDSVSSVLLLWLAGYHFSGGDESTAQQVLFRRDRYEIAREVEKALRDYRGESGARRMQRLFPLTDADAAELSALADDPFPLAEKLVLRFSPRWLLGWRDVCRSTDERTLIATAIPPVAVGHKFMLQFSSRSPRLRLGLLASQDTFTVDYCGRQKLGGTSFSYFVLKQLPVASPEAYSRAFIGGTLLDFITPRVLELVYTAHDLAPLARDCGYEGPPFRWDETRRFQIRAELDAAYLHAYLGPSDAWQPAPAETAEDISRLRAHFPTPKDAAAHILNSFPIVREKDEAAHGSYRTRDSILALYEAFTIAHSNHQPWSSPLNPTPGSS